VEKVVCMGPHSGCRGARVVDDLVIQRKVPVRDSPVPEACRALLAMELEIRPVAGIAVVGAPNLDA